MPHNKTSQAMNTNIYILTLFIEMYKLYPIKLPFVSISTVNKFPKVFIQGKRGKQSGKIFQYVHFQNITTIQYTIF